LDRVVSVTVRHIYSGLTNVLSSPS